MVKVPYKSDDFHYNGFVVVVVVCTNYLRINKRQHGGNIHAHTHA